MSADTGAGLAGVRLDDGRQVFVEGAPPALQLGTRVAIRLAEHDCEGTVSVPPRLIVWRDPEASLGIYSSTIASTPSAPPKNAHPPPALFLADEDQPSAERLNEMLNLAHDEMSRLDD